MDLTKSQLERFLPLQVQTSTLSDTGKNSKVLINEHKKRVFFILQVNDDDFPKKVGCFLFCARHSQGYMFLSSFSALMLCFASLFPLRNRPPFLDLSNSRIKENLLVAIYDYNYLTNILDFDLNRMSRKLSKHCNIIAAERYPMPCSKLVKARKKFIFYHSSAVTLLPFSTCSAVSAERIQRSRSRSSSLH